MILREEDIDTVGGAVYHLRNAKSFSFLTAFISYIDGIYLVTDGIYLVLKMQK